MLTTSNVPEDIDAAYASFANSYIQKPVHFEDFAAALRVIEGYWFQLVTLPSDEESFPPRSAAPEEKDKEALSLLLIEDSEADAIILRGHLGRAYPHTRIDIIAARRVAEARDSVGQRRVDVVMTDLNLPDSSGLDTVFAVRAMQPDAVVMVMTGSGHDGMGRNSIRAGADDYLAKDDLSPRAIRRALAHAQERRHLQLQLQDAARHRLVSRLAGYVAHDFNNLLTVIRAEAHSLTDQGIDEAALEGILDAARRGEQLTRRLLAHGRDQPLHPRPKNVKPLLESQHRTLQRMVGSTVRVHLELPSELPSAAIDPTALEFMLYNLATNARDAMPQGGSLTISATAVTDAVEVTVTDTGIGMPAERVSKVTEPFFSTKGTSSGSGLGLSSVRETMRAHGGTMTLDSEQGRGTTVRLRFRRAVASGPHSDATPEPEIQDKGATILVIDDERAVRRAVSRTLSRAEFKVEVAANGDEAIARCHESNIDLVLTDLMLGDEENGMTLAEELRQGGFRGPVLYMSGYTKVLGGGPNHRLIPGENFIRKPYEPDDLLRLIYRALAGSNR